MTPAESYAIEHHVPRLRTRARRFAREAGRALWRGLVVVWEFFTDPKGPKL